MGVGAGQPRRGRGLGPHQARPGQDVTPGRSGHRHPSWGVEHLPRARSSRVPRSLWSSGAVPARDLPEERQPLEPALWGSTSGGQQVGGEAVAAGVLGPAHAVVDLGKAISRGRTKRGLVGRSPSTAAGRRFPHAGGVHRSSPRRGFFPEWIHVDRRPVDHRSAGQGSVTENEPGTARSAAAALAQAAIEPALIGAATAHRWCRCEVDAASARSGRGAQEHVGEPHPPTTGARPGASAPGPGSTSQGRSAQLAVSTVTCPGILRGAQSRTPTTPPTTPRQATAARSPTASSTFRGQGLLGSRGACGHPAQSRPGISRRSGSPWSRLSGDRPPGTISRGRRLILAEFLFLFFPRAATVDVAEPGCGAHRWCSNAASRSGRSGAVESPGADLVVGAGARVGQRSVSPARRGGAPRGAPRPRARPSRSAPRPGRTAAGRR